MATLSYVAPETSARRTTFTCIAIKGLVKISLSITRPFPNQIGWKNIITLGKPSKYCNPGYVSTKPSMNSVTTSEMHPHKEKKNS